jgi:hypothetical protein
MRRRTFRNPTPEERKIAYLRKQAADREFLSFYNVALPQVRKFWKTYFKTNSFWFDSLSDEDRENFARDTVNRIVEFVRDQLDDKLPITSEQVLRYLNDPRYRSTDKDGMEFPYRDEKGKVWTRSIKSQMVEEFNELSYGQRTPLKRESAPTEDSPGMSLDDFLSTFSIGSSMVDSPSFSYEEQYITSLDDPEEQLEDFEDLDGQLALWLNPGRYTIAPSELSWFRKNLNQPDLTETKLKDRRKAFAEYLILHTVSPAYLKKSDDTLMDAQKAIKQFYQLRVPLEDMRKHFVGNIVKVAKTDIPATLFSVTLSEHVPQLARRRSKPGTTVDWYKANYLWLPLQMYDLLFHPGHKPKSRGGCTRCTETQLCPLHQCPTCERIAQVLTTSKDPTYAQRRIDQALAHLQLEKNWLLEKKRWTWEQKQRATPNPFRSSPKYAKSTIRY